MRRLVLGLAVVMGVLAGAAMAFGQTAEPLAPPEQQAMSDTFQHALEYNKTDQSSDWVNPDTGRSGAVAPTKTYTNAQGQPCREFTSSITIGGKAEQGYGTACRQPDGTWQIVDNEQQTTLQTAPPANVTIYNPPAEYYNYPPDLFYPYTIYLSFGYLYRAGHLYHGAFFLNGRAFRRHYPLHIRERVLLGPHFYHRHNAYRRWGHWERRDYSGYHWPNPDRGRHEWRHRHHRR